ncbi:MAG TPA: carboxypeptidase-like regulatory domain-containing protein, partial [Longimicrobiales bacterium]|nr:carboxypeptidase-like regulatory domain-containing protein [Longimicrobiales bacterium]
MRSMRLFVCASMMLGTAPSVAAQSLAGGTVQGRVADSAGQPVFDATVTLVSATAGFARYARTSRDGEFIFRFAQPGEYEVLIEKVGFHPVVIRGVEVNPGNHARVDAPLAAAPAGEAELRELLYQGTGARPSDHFAISEFILREMPETGRELTSLGRYATVFGEHLGGLGVPGRWAAIRVDGFPVSPLPGVVPAASPMANLPVSWISQAMFLPDGADVGWGGSPGAYVDA